MEKMFDECILLHVRQQLTLADLSRAVQLFSKNVHDESLPTSIQTMSCKLLINLVDCIRLWSKQEVGNGKELLVKMMEVFMLKFMTLSKLHLSSLPQPNPTAISGPGLSSSLATLTPGLPVSAIPRPRQHPPHPRPVSRRSQWISSPPPPTIAGADTNTDQEKKTKFGFPQSQAAN